MKILFAAIPAYGHLYPLMPLALACAEDGHDVTVATGKPFVGRLPLPTIPQQPDALELDGVFAEAARRNPGVQGAGLVVGVFADVTSEAVVEVLVPTLEELQPDLIVYEGMNVGAGVAASLLGIPAVPYAIALTHRGFALIHPEAMSYRRDLWTSRGQHPPEADPLLGQAFLDPTPPSLRRFNGDLDIPKIPIRPVGYAESVAQVPAWLEEPRTRPRVYLTLGTVSFGAVEVLSRAISDISALDVDLLVAVGPEGDPALLGEVSDNVRLERFVDQSRVLPMIDVMVHHGGTGSVLGALSAGVPQVLIPQGADQFFNAEYLTEVGAARVVRNEEQDPGVIRAAVAALLEPDAGERTVARQLQAEIADLPSPASVIPELVSLASR